MKKQKVDTKLGVAIIVIFAMTTGALMWIYENKTSKPTQQNQITNNVQQKNQAQKQETVIPPIEVGSKNQNIQTNTWKPYINSKDGYSIKYPPTWISNFVDGSSFYVKELKKPGERFPNFGNVLSDNLENLKNVSGDYFINISVYKKMGTHVKLKEWKKCDATNNCQDVLIQGYPALKFNDKPHKSYGGTNKDMAGSLTYYFINNKNDGYAISIWYKDASNGIGDSIVSTLNLLN